MLLLDRGTFLGVISPKLNCPGPEEQQEKGKAVRAGTDLTQ